MDGIPHRRGRAWPVRLLTALVALVVAGGVGATSRAAAAPAASPRPTVAAAAAGDSPSGFWWGTDSWPVPVPGRGPYGMPFLDGAYGGYIGMTGNWAYWLGCSGQEHFLAFAPTNAAQAHTNFRRYGKGVGDGAYWFMGGPGVDPHWNGTAAEARAWGARQAAKALSDIAGRPLDQPVVWMDIELPGDTPARDNGWNDVYTSPCSGVVRQSFIPAAIDRADFNGFWDYVAHHSHLHPGVYSDPAVWSSIFGTGAASRITGTDEWTYEPETRNYRTGRPRGWCLRTGGCAQFFGGVTRTSSHALMWQWSGGGGATNGIGGFNGDLDQIDAARLR
ncbi:MAG TPA: hypothetical protein VFN65_14025 [Solirubrobacteraceae bacterium]|nr:hypothetical protein [Solirubrobacteraceae bacterium]